MPNSPNFRMQVSVDDRASGVLKNVQQSFRRFARDANLSGMARDFYRLEVSAGSLAASLRRGVMPALGATGAIAGTAVLGLASLTKTLQNFAAGRLGLSQMAREAGLTAGQLDALQKAGAKKLIAPEEMQQGVKSFSDTLYQMRHRTKESIDVFREMNRVRLPGLFNELQNFADRGDTAGALESLFRAFDRLNKVDPSGAQARNLARILGLSESLARINPGSTRPRRQFTDEERAAAEKFHDAVLDINEAASDLATTIGNELMPKLLPMVQQLNAFVTANKGDVGNGIAGAIREIGAAATTSFEWIKNTVDFLNKLKKISDDFAARGGVAGAIRDGLTGKSPDAESLNRDADKPVAPNGGTAGGALWDRLRGLFGGDDKQQKLQQLEKERDELQKKRDASKPEEREAFDRKVRETTEAIDRLRKAIELLPQKQSYIAPGQGRQAGVMPASFSPGGGLGGSGGPNGRFGGGALRGALGGLGGGFAGGGGGAGGFPGLGGGGGGGGGGGFPGLGGRQGGDAGGGGQAGVGGGQGDQGGQAGQGQGGQGGGGSGLAAQRADIMSELDRDPATRTLAMQMMSTEGGAGGGQAALEALVNRTAMIRQKKPGHTLKDELNSGFYGPINRGKAQRTHISDSQRKKYDAIISKVAGGSNLIQGRTDQGMVGDPNAGGPGRIHVGGSREIYNFWKGRRGGQNFSYTDSQRFADQQNRLASGGGGGGGGLREGGGEPASGGVPSAILSRAREVAATQGPGGVSSFMASQGYPKNGAWCGQFAASVVRSSGGTPPKGAAVASNWRNWGAPVDNPQPGDIAVRRNSRFGGYARTGATGSHVTIVDSVDQNGRFQGIGGNQGALKKSFPTGQYEFRRGIQPRGAQGEEQGEGQTERMRRMQSELTRPQDEQIRLDQANARDNGVNINGGADINVKVQAPRGTSVSAKSRGIFRDTKIERGTAMEPTPTADANAYQE